MYIKSKTMDDKILELMFYCLPAVITGGVAYYAFQTMLQNEDKKRRFSMLREGRKFALPLRLQAYERMTIFLERIDPVKLLVRVTPTSDDKDEYTNLLTGQIEQEFEHNMAQQIYVSDECWTVISTAKNATIQMIRKTSADAQITSASALRETILNNQFDKPSASSTALAYIRNEVKSLI